MRKGTNWRRTAMVVGLTVLLLGGAAGSADAAGKGWLKREGKAAKCGKGFTLVEIQYRTCPANGRRQAIPTRRACCEKKGKRICKPFVKCPKISPS